MNLPLLQPHDSDESFDVSPEKSFTMPARYYHDGEIHEREKDAIFYRNWWFAGHVSQVPNPGDYLTASIHDQAIFVIRSRDGVINGFYNVCQHRGHGLLKGNGRSKVIVCPYHAWTYGTDGQLVKARNTEKMIGFNKGDFALKPVRVEVFCSLIFVNLDPDAIPLEDQAGDLESEIRHYCPRIDELVFAQRDTYRVRANWKVLVDNFLECYHCHPAHHDFVDLVDMEAYRSRAHGIYSSHCSDRARSNDNAAFRFETGEVDFGYAAWFLWPNLTLWVYPGEPNISTLQMIPDGVGHTIEYQDWFIASSEPSEQMVEAMHYQKEVLQPEDVALCESVQAGLQSKGYHQGRFVVDTDFSELSEHCVHHFQKMVVEAMGGPVRDG